MWTFLTVLVNLVAIVYKTQPERRPDLVKILKANEEADRLEELKYGRQERLPRE